MPICVVSTAYIPAARTTNTSLILFTDTTIRWKLNRLVNCLVLLATHSHWNLASVCCLTSRGENFSVMVISPPGGTHPLVGSMVKGHTSSPSFSTLPVSLLRWRLVWETADRGSSRQVQVKWKVTWPGFFKGKL